MITGAVASGIPQSQFPGFVQSLSTVPLQVKLGGALSGEFIPTVTVDEVVHVLLSATVTL